MWTRFKDWLRKSGITYQYAVARDEYRIAGAYYLGDSPETSHEEKNPGPTETYTAKEGPCSLGRSDLNGRKALQGTEMLDSLNPFDAVIRIPEAPWATIHQNSFFEGLKGTFNVLMGNHYDFYLTGGGRVGVLDLLIFPLIGRRLMGYAHDDKNNMVFRCIAGVIAYPLELARGVLGVGLTIFLSPIVLLVHIGLFIKNQFLEKRFQEVNIAEYTVEGDTHLAETLSSRSGSLKLKDIVNVLKTSYGEDISLARNRHQPIISSEGFICVKLFHDKNERINVRANIKINKDNRDGLEAAIEANLYGISTMLHRHRQFSLFNKLTGKTPASSALGTAQIHSADTPTETTGHSRSTSPA